MWTIIKFDKKNLSLLQNDLKQKLDGNLKFYIPKMIIKKFNNNKLIEREQSLLSDYLFCYHEDFKTTKIIENLKYLRGLKYFLNGFKESQKEIKDFIIKCKGSEDKKGFLSGNFFELDLKKKYKFLSGLFANKVFEINDFQKNKIRIVLGSIKTTVENKDLILATV